MISLSSFPEEIQLDILLRLPVESILTCKCVSKVWCSLVSSPEFIKNHLDLSIQTTNPRLMYVGCKANPTIHSIDYNSIAATSGEPTCNPGGATEIDCPVEYEGQKNVHFIGSCNGLICLGITNHIASADKDDNFYVIWNPATREYKKVTPSCDISFAHTKYGFGYDRYIDDYKLVRIENKYGFPTEILVYALGSDSWKTIETDLSRCFNTGNTHGVLLNGVLHWFGATSNTFFNFILAFNISNEKLIHVPLPEGITPLAPQVYKSVRLWGDCLSLVDVIMGCGRTDVWVMQNYGVTKSWTKKFTISEFTITMLCNPKLIWCQKDGEILIGTGYGFVLFNPTNERVRKVHLHGTNSVVISVLDYMESLVSPQGPSGRKTK